MKYALDPSPRRMVGKRVNPLGAGGGGGFGTTVQLSRSQQQNTPSVGLPPHSMQMEFESSPQSTVSGGGRRRPVSIAAAGATSATASSVVAIVALRAPRHVLMKLLMSIPLSEPSRGRFG